MMTATKRRTAKSAHAISEHIPSRLFVVAEVSVDNTLKSFGVATTDEHDADLRATDIRESLDDFESYPRLVAIELTAEQRIAIQDALGVR